MRLLLILLLFASCTKQQAPSESDPITVEVEIEAEEESNVSHYEIEASDDGIQFRYIGQIPSLNKQRHIYRGKFEAPSGRYFRVKAVDVDKRFAYSDISAW